MIRRLGLLFILILSGVSCTPDSIDADFLIKGGTIIDGSGAESIVADLAIKDDRIVFIGNSDSITINAQTTVNAKGKIVSPGFIDPHTHSLGDLKNENSSANLNYLTQGVTTVVNGNDGEGPYEVTKISSQLMGQGIGTNTAFFVGHNTVRSAVLGADNIAPDTNQLEEMKRLVKQGMEEGALGFSTGLYYAPGSYSKTDEVVELAKVIAPFSGIYDSHIRDESTYNIGLIAAVEETIEIGRKSGVPIHFAHIKALGVDVWKRSDEIIELIEEAQQTGLTITADQYPWRASGTHLENALIDRWVMAGGEDKYYDRLQDKRLLPRIKEEIEENLRKRGGAESILITADARNEEWIGKNLAQLSQLMQKPVIEVILEIARSGGARIASFNMNPYDLENFMTRPWVMTSSDGTKGHPRKFASYPEKYKKYVIEKHLLSVESFVHKSSGGVAKIFGIEQRGELKQGYYADVIIINPKRFTPKADFSKPDVLSEGVEFVWVNGKLVIENSNYNNRLEGKVLLKGQ